jgi:general secretion pathway protein J
MMVLAEPLRLPSPHGAKRNAGRHSRIALRSIRATRPRPLARARQAGFTLVEVLVALILLSLLTMALFFSVRFGVTAWQRGTGRSDQIHTSMLVQDLLRRLIGQAYPLVLSDGSGNGRVDFEGTSTSLDFLAPVPVALASGGRARFKLSIERHGDGSDLVVTSRPELAAADAATELSRKTLLATIETAEFSYFGAVQSDGAAQWHDRWSGEMTLPMLVRVRLRFARGDPRLWPDLTIAPRITADVGCVYDPLTKLCRGR